MLLAGAGEEGVLASLAAPAARIRQAIDRGILGHPLPPSAQVGPFASYVQGAYDAGIWLRELKAAYPALKRDWEGVR